MLTLLAYGMVLVFMVLIMTDRLSALLALILMPIAFALIGGFGATMGPMMIGGMVDTVAPAPPERRPHLLYVNLGLTLVLMTCLLLGVLPLPILFMVGFAIAMVINYPDLAEQKRRIAAHAPNVLAVVSLIFAAGIFTGILAGTGMVEAMARSVTGIIPDSAGPFLPVITALLSIPFTFLVSNDAFYFGILLILAEAGAAYGHSAEAMGRASLVGQQVHLLSPLVASTYLLVGLCEIDFGAHQRFRLPWALGMAAVMLAAGVLIGVIPPF